MNKNAVQLLKLYLELPLKDRMDFLAELTKLEKMNRAVKQDYLSTLRSQSSGNTE